ncbi:MAG: hypothetical protein V7735_09255 [Photobacterium frigidiphilum]|uniref:hypothetical protein n=1 Tax=Photobacterium frigidiphilum TaxID=264736 RepID=UPI0030021AAC
MGGGGKTSTAFWLAQEFKKRGHCVLVSKTNYQNPLSLFAIKMKQRRIMEK